MVNKLLPVLAVVAIALVLVSGHFIPEPVIDQTSLKRFSSYDELKNFLEENAGAGYYGYGVFRAMTGTAESGATKDTSAPSASTDYSQTNIQVEGVDEADIVKNDGKYIYVVSGNSVVILDAYPAETAKIVSQLDFDGSVNNIFLNDDRLIVFEQDYGYYYATGVKTGTAEIGIAPRSYTQQSFVKVYDISDRANPTLERNVSVDGYYYDSRMIGDYVYVIVNQAASYIDPLPMPRVLTDGVEKTVAASDIYYFPVPDTSYQYTNILAINTQNDEAVNMKTYLTGYSQNLYVSESNIFMVYQKRVSEVVIYDRIIDEAIVPSVPADIQVRINEVKSSSDTTYEKYQEISVILYDYLKTLNPEEGANLMKMIGEKTEKVYQDAAKEMEKTVIHKISISNGNIEYKTNGEVPGQTLNQFSMDEYNDYFRIATTTANWQTTSANHVYVLDSNLKIVGKLEDLAAGERIYSVRFMGDKAYMVTFRQIDPLFVIDLSNPTNPQVLGFLKIPGVSDYLHPYDETHVIGVGRDATDKGMIKGMKLSLFDVSDVSNPKEISTYFIGDRGTYSEALNDHKAFLFSKEKNLLVIPVSVTEKGQYNYWQGAYVFGLDLTNGFELKGKITHTNETGEDEYYDYYSQVRRSLYIDNVLYTISTRMVKANSLADLVELNKVALPNKEEVYPYYRAL